jgi:hypothetical protein
VPRVGEVAFLLLVHERPEHVRRLAVTLAPSPVYIHVDARSALDFGGSARMSHVRMIERVPVCWGGFSVVDATLRLVASALEDPQVDHLVLLSGSCYPIRSPQELRTFLHITDDCQLRYLPAAEARHIREHLSRRWFFDAARYPGGTFLRRALHYSSTLLVPERGRVPGDLVPHYGSQWWSLTRSCAELVLREYRENKPLVNYFRRTFAPDELFVQTIVANSVHARPHHLIPYQGRATFTDAALHFIAGSSAGIGGTHRVTPAQLDTQRCLEDLAASGKFFARKICDDQDLDRIDSMLLARECRAPAERAIHIGSVR